MPITTILNAVEPELFFLFKHKFMIFLIQILANNTIFMGL